MRQIHCDGCNRTEPLGVPKEDSIMMTVSLVHVTDARSWADSGNERYEADLCDRCRPQLLNTFFNISGDTDLELPSFLSVPVSALGT